MSQKEKKIYSGCEAWPLQVQFPDAGPMTVDELTMTPTADGLCDVHINRQQRFTDVPVSAWQCYIGGYQPAQKWLKDRRGRRLSFDDVLHYLRLLHALQEATRIMSELQ